MMFSLLIEIYSRKGNIVLTTEIFPPIGFIPNQI